MSEPDRMTKALAEAQAALRADALVRDRPPGAPGRRDRMRGIIQAVATHWEVERMDLTMALAAASATSARGLRQG